MGHNFLYTLPFKSLGLVSKKDALNCSKVTVNSTTFLFCLKNTVITFLSQINAVLWTFYYFIYKNPKKCTTVSTKILSSMNAFDINNKKCFLSTKLIILEWFLKDHLTLKTGVMIAILTSNIYPKLLNDSAYDYYYFLYMAHWYIF